MRPQAVKVASGHRIALPWPQHARDRLKEDSLSFGFVIQAAHMDTSDAGANGRDRVENKTLSDRFDRQKIEQCISSSTVPVTVVISGTKSTSSALLSRSCGVSPASQALVSCPGDG